MSYVFRRRGIKNVGSGILIFGPPRPWGLGKMRDNPVKFKFAKYKVAINDLVVGGYVGVSCGVLFMKVCIFHT